MWKKNGNGRRDNERNGARLFLRTQFLGPTPTPPSRRRFRLFWFTAAKWHAGRLTGFRLLFCSVSLFWLIPNRLPSFYRVSPARVFPLTAKQSHVWLFGGFFSSLKRSFIVASSIGRLNRFLISTLDRILLEIFVVTFDFFFTEFSRLVSSYDEAVTRVTVWLGKLFFLLFSFFLLLKLKFLLLLFWPESFNSRPVHGLFACVFCFGFFFWVFQF